MKYKIYPAIGIARLGQDDDMILCQETPGQGPVEMNADGTTAPCHRYKSITDKAKIRKQGARFRIFSSENGVDWSPARLPETATVVWTVSLINKKAAIKRPAEPPIAPVRPVIDPALGARVINAGTASISGADQRTPAMAGRYAIPDAGFEKQVTLGYLRTDANGNLIVLGGDGVSGAPDGTPIGASYYKNPGWFDDVSDGPVNAEIRFADGTTVKLEGGAWVIVGPPDFAPGLDGIVTLHDVITQVGIDTFGILLSDNVVYERDILPLVQRVSRLRWVHDSAAWSDPRLASVHLADPTPTHGALRAGVRDLIILVQSELEGHTNANGPAFELRKHQLDKLDKWVAGDFTSGTHWTEDAGALATRSALESAVGQGFCPGIEAGILVLDSSIYQTPFDYRIDHAKLEAGDMTALMAQPWQADFLKCNTEWWPSQRPDLAPQAPAGSTTKPWFRGVQGHAGMVAQFGKLGIIALSEGPNEVFLEVERDPSLP